MKPKPFDVPGSDADRSRTSAREALTPAEAPAVPFELPWRIVASMSSTRRGGKLYVRSASDRLVLTAASVPLAWLQMLVAAANAHARYERTLQLIASWEPPDRDGGGSTWNDMIELAERTLKGEAPA